MWGKGKQQQQNTQESELTDELEPRKGWQELQCNLGGQREGKNPLHLELV